jgi:hypothetical protein
MMETILILLVFGVLGLLLVFGLFGDIIAALFFPKS